LQDEYSDPAAGSVIASDFYNSSALMPLDDDAIVKKVQANIAMCEPQFAAAKVGGMGVMCCRVTPSSIMQ
jgi:hypothetical protein